MKKQEIAEIKIVGILPCIADPVKIRFHAQLNKDISEILPYLNSLLDSAIYNHYGKTLTIRKNGTIISIYSHDIYGAKVNDERDVIQILEWLKEKINYCYRNKSKIQPNYDRRQNLQPVDVYKLLPGLNCKKCEESACFTFAIKIVNGEKNIMQCVALFTPQYKEKRNILLHLLKSAGYTVPSIFLD